MTTTEQTKFNLNKLAGLLGALDRDTDNERQAAAKLATDYMKRCGLTWHQVLCEPIAAPAAQPPPRRSSPFGFYGRAKTAEDIRAEQQAAAARRAEAENLSAFHDLMRDAARRERSGRPTPSMPSSVKGGHKAYELIIKICEARLPTASGKEAEDLTTAVANAKRWGDRLHLTDNEWELFSRYGAEIGLCAYPLV